jgi:hypothetical protein
MSATAYSIRDVMRRKRPDADPVIAPAVVRLPVSCGEFVAQWPQHASAEDLELCRTTISAILTGWAIEARRRGDELDASEVEYRSWFEGGGKRP